MGKAVHMNVGALCDEALSQDVVREIDFRHRFLKVLECKSLVLRLG